MFRKFIQQKNVDENKHKGEQQKIKERKVRTSKERKVADSEKTTRKRLANVKKPSVK